ncbi:hypothetical protein ACFY13_46025 [Streptomyces mirabilis]|uniref:hypothetical protein n=1 Tax=Streptomyces mirabilis TaxID=68239 RepID=UPI0036C657DE
MSGARWLYRAAAAGAPDVSQLLREQLVEVISSIRSQAAMMHGLALEGAGDLPVTVRAAGRSDGGDLLALAEDPP